MSTVIVPAAQVNVVRHRIAKALNAFTSYCPSTPKLVVVYIPFNTKLDAENGLQNEYAIGLHGQMIFSSCPLLHKLTLRDILYTAIRNFGEPGDWDEHEKFAEARAMAFYLLGSLVNAGRDRILKSETLKTEVYAVEREAFETVKDQITPERINNMIARIDLDRQLASDAAAEAQRQKDEDRRQLEMAQMQQPDAHAKSMH